MKYKSLTAKRKLEIIDLVENGKTREKEERNCYPFLLAHTVPY